MSFDPSNTISLCSSSQLTWLDFQTSKSISPFDLVIVTQLRPISI